jgi:signal transduction histidine kinase
MWRKLFETPWPDQFDLPTAVRHKATRRIRSYWRWLIVPVILGEVVLWSVAAPQGISIPNAYGIPPLILSLAFAIGLIPRIDVLWLIMLAGLLAAHGMLIKGLGGITSATFMLPYTFAAMMLAGRTRILVQACCVIGFWYSLFYEILPQTPGLNPPRYFLVSYNLLMATVTFQGLRFLNRLVIELNTEHVTEEVAKEVTQRSQQFLARVSHELRTPLNSVLGFAKMLRRGKNFTEAQTDYLKQIVDEGEQLNTLVSDLLDSAHLATGKLTLDLSPCDVNTICASVAGEFRTLIRPPVTLRTELAVALPAVTADPLRVGQIVRNLLGNALKYTPSGEIVLRTAQRANRIEIAISDTGPGIPEEQQSLVFVPFVKLDNRSAGVGLGLDIAQQLAKLHGGEIRLESAPGRGSTFTLELPVIRP